MSNKDKQRSGTEILADISAYAFDAETLPTDQEASKYLAENQIDISGLETWATERLRLVRTKQKLKMAAIKHQAFIKRFDELKASVAQTSSDVRKRVFEKLQVLAGSSEEAALVYCRKLEETPEEDLLDLEVEIMMLEEWEDEPKS